LNRLIVAPVWSECYANGDDRAVARAMAGRCFGEDGVHQSADFHVRLFLGLQAAAAVIAQQRTDIVLLLVLEIIERKLDMKSLAGPGNQLIRVVALLPRCIAGRKVQEASQYWEFGLLGGVRLAGLLANAINQLCRLQVANLVRIDLDAELIMNPAAGGA